jgi:hypothetical protein
MKKIVLTTMMSLALVIMSVSKGLTEDPRAMTALHGYTLKNNPGPGSDFNIWVVTHESAFDEEFIAGQDATVKPDFGKQIAVAINAETSNYVYQVNFTRSELVKDELHVYFTVRKASVDAMSGMVNVAALEKKAGLKKIHFYHDNVRIRTVPIVSVY